MMSNSGSRHPYDRIRQSLAGKIRSALVEASEEEQLWFSRISSALLSALSPSCELPEDDFAREAFQLVVESCGQGMALPDMDPNPSWLSNEILNKLRSECQRLREHCGVRKSAAIYAPLGEFAQALAGHPIVISWAERRIGGPLVYEGAGCYIRYERPDDHCRVHIDTPEFAVNLLVPIYAASARCPPLRLFSANSFRDLTLCPGSAIIFESAKVPHCRPEVGDVIEVLSLGYRHKIAASPSLP